MNIIEQAQEALETARPYLEDLVAMEKKGVATGFKPGIPARDLAKINKAINRINEAKEP